MDSFEQLRIETVGAGPPVVLLHGWGTHRGSLRGVASWLEARHTCHLVDLPGFGEAPPPPEPWDSAAYVDLLARWMSACGLGNAWLIGHSFGGKLALLLAARGAGCGVVAFGAAGVRRRRSPLWHLRVSAFKLCKLLARVPVLAPLFRDIVTRVRATSGSSDYRAASGVMRGTLVRVIREDIRVAVRGLDRPVLLIYGEQDDDTPPDFGRRLAAEMLRAQVTRVPGAGHYAFLDQPARVRVLVESFLASTPERRA